MSIGNVTTNQAYTAAEYAKIRRENRAQSYQDVSAIVGAKSGKSAPYDYLAENGIIEYKGVTFVCDTERNRLCLGNVENPKDCITVSLSDGGCLVFNRDMIGELSRAIGMFSPEDVNRIMQAIALDTKIQQIKNELEEEESSIGEKVHTDAKRMQREQQEKEYREMLDEKMQKFFGRFPREEETAYPIGGQYYTEKEWDKILERFDMLQDEIKEEIKERIKKQNVQAEKERVEEKKMEEKERTENYVEDVLERKRISDERYKNSFLYES